MTDLKLLIREISPRTSDGRYIRESFRRIKQFLDDVEAGKKTLVSFSTLGGSPSDFDAVETKDTTVVGQTTFTLTSTPSAPSLVQMEINGIPQTNGEHFTVSGNVVTFDPVAAGFTLETSNEFGQPDRVIIRYNK